MYELIKKFKVYNSFRSIPLGQNRLHIYVKKILFPQSKIIYVYREASSWLNEYKKFEPQIDEKTIIRNREVVLSRFIRYSNEGYNDTLMINITDGWEFLCRFLSKGIPRKKFPVIIRRIKPPDISVKIVPRLDYDLICKYLHENDNFKAIRWADGEYDHTTGNCVIGYFEYHD